MGGAIEKSICYFTHVTGLKKWWINVLHDSTDLICLLVSTGVCTIV